MTKFLSQQKKFFILTFSFLLIAFTTIFIVSESTLDINHNDLQAFVLNNENLENAQSEEFYRELLNKETGDIFMLKKDTTIEFSTENWREDFGYYKDEIEGENFFTLIHPKDLPYFANEIVELVNSTERSDNIGPIRIKDYNGEYSLFIINAIPIVNEHNELVRIGLILIDVSLPLGGTSGVEEVLAFNPFGI